MDSATFQPSSPLTQSVSSGVKITIAIGCRVALGPGSRSRAPGPIIAGPAAVFQKSAPQGAKRDRWSSGGLPEERHSNRAECAGRPTVPKSSGLAHRYLAGRHRFRGNGQSIARPLEQRRSRRKNRVQHNRRAVAEQRFLPQAACGGNLSFGHTFVSRRQPGIPPLVLRRSGGRNPFASFPPARLSRSRRRDVVFYSGVSFSILATALSSFCCCFRCSAAASGLPSRSSVRRKGSPSRTIVSQASLWSEVTRLWESKWRSRERPTQV